MLQVHSRGQAHGTLYAPYSWSAALSASLIAGLAFAVVEVGANWAFRGVAPSVLLRMTGALVLGPDTLAPPVGFDLGVVLAATVVHLALSIVYGTFFALVLPRVEIAPGILLGGLYGLALYYVNFYGFNIFSPWFAGMRDWVSIASHFVFGAVLACAYNALNQRWLAVRRDR